MRTKTITFLISLLILHDSFAIIQHVLPVCARPGLDLGVKSGSLLGSFGAAAYTGAISSCPTLIPHLTMVGGSGVLPALLSGPFAPVATIITAGLVGGALGGTAGSLISCREVGLQNGTHALIQEANYEQEDYENQYLWNSPSDLDYDSIDTMKDETDLYRYDPTNLQNVDINDDPSRNNWLSHNGQRSNMLDNTLRSKISVHGNHGIDRMKRRKYESSMRKAEENRKYKIRRLDHFKRQPILLSKRRSQLSRKAISKLLKSKFRKRFELVKLKKGKDKKLYMKRRRKNPFRSGFKRRRYSGK
ncbi:unnamed protein product [Lepeophtheirus salmonis]|uniref:(salmon louse) hypothetical protein n=1 Tax=Lepeophtheirus salmonis TaxID=72036 RepID=A0A7R8CT81_LEPSM|nr:unnamed protein product [Lepeophtheirus salmonis]CAF2886291.1 unnamed protein product [Lepeophtheirus salmonis]